MSTVQWSWLYRRSESEQYDPGSTLRPASWLRTPRQTWEGGRWEKTQIYWTGRGVNTQHSTLNTRHLTDRWWPMEVEVTELELNWALHQNLSRRVREWESQQFEHLARRAERSTRAMCRKLEDCLLGRTGFRVFVITAVLIVLAVMGLYRWVLRWWWWWWRWWWFILLRWVQRYKNKS